MDESSTEGVAGGGGRLLGIGRRLTRAAMDLSWIEWSTVRGIGNSPIVRLTAIMPFVGYLIIYTDLVQQLYCTAWTELANRKSADCAAFGRDFATRLHLLYLGLFLIGCGSLVFSVGCPRVVRRYADANDFVREEYETASKRNVRYYSKRVRELDPEMALVVKTSNAPAMARITGRPESASPAALTDEDYRDAKVDVMRAYFVSCNAFARRRALRACTLLFLAGFALVSLPNVAMFLNITWIVAKRLSAWAGGLFLP